MARADLLKQLFLSYQQRDDRAFREAANELVQEERKKHHPALANELEMILKNGRRDAAYGNGLAMYEPAPQDSDRQVPLLEVRRPRRYLNDLVLDGSTVGLLERILQEFREWEVLEANGLPPVQRVLFCGPPGCGKTATAEALATELDLPLLYVRFDAIVSSLLGQTAANLRKVFDYATRGQWVMLFDEFDAIARSRDDATEHGELKRVLNSFLQIMDNFTGRSLIIAATNFEQVLDPAIWRRFDEVIRFEKPDAAKLSAVVRKRLAPLKFDQANVKRIVAVIGHGTYADAERVCLDLRRSAAIRGTRFLHSEDLDAALERHEYRLAVLEKAVPQGPVTVDKE